MIHEITRDMETVRPFLIRLNKLFFEMDRAYEAAAADYAFHCSGCMDNCCRTRFHHHTLLEYLSLYDGFSRLNETRRAEVRYQAQTWTTAGGAGKDGGTHSRVMCPLNVHGLCILYNHRPMICRLHGIPHELHRPGGSAHYGPGCSAFDNRSGNTKYTIFDRTPYYIDLSGLEGEFRKLLGFSGKIKLTVADMLVSYTP